MLHDHPGRRQPTAQTRTPVIRADDPTGPTRAPSSRAMEMGETMREIFFRDGNVTEMALIAEGYSAGEIVELGEDARRHVNLVITVPGGAFDRLPTVSDKAVNAIAGAMPVMAGAKDAVMMAVAWQSYCTAVGAHRLDPWVSQSERCLSRLKVFLAHLPLLEREKNAVITAVAVSLKKRIAA
ncbi:hypothetical protein [Mesorhizobium sp. CAU 1732]|uniref:hypothetical protein n=1 Tax=Mesorhizobium sp. CAU 1732 TaxID=3140358 RepID=UPI003260FFA4